jgi:hypothetical protein
MYFMAAIVSRTFYLSDALLSNDCLERALSGDCNQFVQANVASSDTDVLKVNTKCDFMPMEKEGNEYKGYVGYTFNIQTPDIKRPYLDPLKQVPANADQQALTLITVGVALNQQWKMVLENFLKDRQNMQKGPVAYVLGTIQIEVERKNKPASVFKQTFTIYDRTHGQIAYNHKLG